MRSRTPTPRAALAAGVCACLAAGELPPLPPLPPLPAPEAAPLPAPEALLPLRPYQPGGRGQGGTPFLWRGERLVESPESWSIERGAVEYEGVLLLADRITYRPGADELEAEGSIRLEAPGLRLRCQRLKMNRQEQIGEAWFLELELPPSWNLRADHVAFTTFRHWQFEGVQLSPCPQENPGWSAKLSSLKLDLDGFATFRNARVYLGGVFLPPYFIPWATYPAKAQRSSGLLPPQLGLGSSSVGLAWYQVLGDTMDATLSPEYYRRQGLLWGGEFRWNPDPTHQGSFQGQYINEKDTGRRRYRYSLHELWQREDGWQVTAEVNQASDSLLDADYGRSVGTLGTTSFDSNLYVGRNFSWAALSVSAAEQRTFFMPEDPFYIPDFPTSLRRQTLPQIQARVYPVPLGRFYLDAGLRLGRHAYRFQVGEETGAGNYLWNRGDLVTRLQGRLGQWGPFRSDLQVAARGTWYSKGLRKDVFDPELGSDGSSFEPALDPFRVDAKGMVRKLLSARLQFSGPQLGRSFEKVRLFGYAGELKHVLEPFFGLTATGGSGENGRVPRFDEVDSRPGVGGSAAGERSFELGLKQHLLGRPGPGVSFTDLLRWRLSTRYHFRPVLLPDGRYKQGWASLDNDIDLEPNETLRVSFRRSSEMGVSGADNALSADYRSPSGTRFSLAFFSTGINRFLVRQRGLQVGGLQRVWDDRCRVEFSANYDFRLRTFSNVQAALAWVAPCTAVSLRYSHVFNQIPTARENRLDLTLTLRGLGDLLSYRW